MFDASLRPWMDPPLDRVAQWAVRFGWTANAVTLGGLGLGLTAALAIAFEAYALGLALLLASRLADGLDGAIARRTGATDFGGYLDILCDFAFYAAIPLAFGLADPANRFAALVLLASFLLSGTSFLAWAALAEKRGLKTETQGKKSFFYRSGLIEGSETIAFFSASCLLPAHFPALAFVFAALCALTAIQRALAARRDFEG